MANDDKRYGNHIPSCSFCHKKQNQVTKLIEGDGVYICNECVELCMSILGENSRYQSSDSGKIKDFDSLPKPHQIKELLDQYVIGQEKAKDTLCPTARL